MSANNFSAYRGRLAKAGAAIADALRGLPDVGEIADDLATTFQKSLVPRERLTVALSVMMSLDPDSRDTLIRTAERGRKADSVFRRAWRHG